MACKSIFGGYCELCPFCLHLFTSPGWYWERLWRVMLNVVALMVPVVSANKMRWYLLPFLLLSGFPTKATVNVRELKRGGLSNVITFIYRCKCTDIPSVARTSHCLKWKCWLKVWSLSWKLGLWAEGLLWVLLMLSCGFRFPQLRRWSAGLGWYRSVCLVYRWVDSTNWYMEYLQLTQCSCVS